MFTIRFIDNLLYLCLLSRLRVNNHTILPHLLYKAADLVATNYIPSSYTHINTCTQSQYHITRSEHPCNWPPYPFYKKKKTHTIPSEKPISVFFFVRGG